MLLEREFRIGHYTPEPVGGTPAFDFKTHCSPQATLGFNLIRARMMN